ncbi:MAG: hypothetical protein DMG57_35905 [Acidobacteria bacterium]|nr:MAG: hypothetical protein DMG57_35905 [Acidobacteriota bacterium]
MRERGIKENAALQSYFNTRVEPLARKHGKTMIGWDEVLDPNLPKDIVIQSWRGQKSLKPHVWVTPVSYRPATISTSCFRPRNTMPPIHSPGKLRI